MANRREFLAGVAAAAAAASLPLPAIVKAAEPGAQQLLAFVAGTEGEFDWKPFFARTEGEAMQMAREWFGYVDDEYFGFEFQRVKRWDARGAADKVTPADWIRADLGHTCSRCHDETFGGEGGYAVGEEVVCEECLTLPERLTIRHPYDAVDELADRIADDGEAAAREWVEREGAWAAAEPHWAKAIEQAAS